MVRAGQVWKAPAPRVHGGFRYVRIEEVRLAKARDDAYANAVEITENGKRVRPSHSLQIRGLCFSIKLSGDTLPSPYELVE